ncbi:hypothetical protein BJY00DRAFT_195772 [Aspergillus carlsbadensis]|nr:hypothetical protein BJY00DRAFT_195772 [Aspergillus carlsbadensis]
MTAITAEHVAIAELVVYIPTSLLTIFVVLRHGFHKQLGWIYLSIFCGIRVAGAILQILSHNNPSNTDELEWAVILQAVGLSPLLLASLGLLKRIFDEITTRVPSSKGNQIVQTLARSRGPLGVLLGLYNRKATAVSRRSRVVQLLHIPALVSLILAIAGGTDQNSSNPSDQKSGRTEMRAAIILFLILYIALAFLWIITARDVSGMVTTQKRIYFVVFLALPFLAVRMLYSLLGVFGNHPQFSMFGGSVSVRLGMAIVEEFVVVVLYTVLGIFTPRANGGDAEQVSRPNVGHGRPEKRR